MEDKLAIHPYLEELLAIKELTEEFLSKGKKNFLFWKNSLQAWKNFFQVWKKNL